jgi:DNA (cytosine-5)-methyltransferase 1
MCQGVFLLTVGSLFSGIAGFERGLESAGGFRTLWQVEQNERCRFWLRRHYPHSSLFQDVHNVGRANLETVDVICGGFPCQPHSVAGKRGGSADGRYLWPEFARVVREMEPRFVAVENTTGLLTDGTAGRVLGELASLGYDAEWAVLSARDAGAIHTRDRLFITAHHRGERVQGFCKYTFFRQPEFSWVEDVRRPEDLRGRSDLPEPLVRRAGDGLSPRLHALGNAVVPQVARVVGERLLEIADAVEQEAA